MITISNSHLTATIDPEGAELVSLRSGNREYMWEGNPEFWGKHSPVLFPIVGTLKNNTYIWDDKSYMLSRHGFARDNSFEVIQNEQDTALFTLSATNETLASYPFNFTLQMHYSLKGNTLSIAYTVKNNGTDIMPFSLGAHPAFALPGSFEDYALIFENDDVLITTPLENDLLASTKKEVPLTQNKLPLSYSLFENDALVMKEFKSDRIILKKGQMDILGVEFKGFPHLGLWTKPRAPFLCIEPWQGYADSIHSSGKLEEKEGIILLSPGKTHESGLSIELFR